MLILQCATCTYVHIASTDYLRMTKPFSTQRVADMNNVTIQLHTCGARPYFVRIVLHIWSFYRLFWPPTLLKRPSLLMVLSMWLIQVSANKRAIILELGWNLLWLFHAQRYMFMYIFKELLKVHLSCMRPHNYLYEVVHYVKVMPRVYVSQIKLVSAAAGVWVIGR